MPRPKQAIDHAAPGTVRRFRSGRQGMKPGPDRRRDEADQQQRDEQPARRPVAVPLDQPGGQERTQQAQMEQAEAKGLRGRIRMMPLLHWRKTDGQILAPLEHLNHQQQQEEPCRDGFDQRIAEGNRLAAVAATSPQPEPGQHGNIVVGADRVFASRAVRAGPGDAHAGRQSIDDHVQETAHGPAHEKEPGGDHPACRFEGEQIHALILNSRTEFISCSRTD